MAGRPPGSLNKHKPFRAALTRRVEWHEQNNGPHSLEKLAEALLAKAAHGDLMAMKEITDRLDGKVPNIVGGSSETDPIQVTGIGWLEKTASSE